MPNISWVWLIVGLALGFLVLPRVKAAVGR